MQVSTVKDKQMNYRHAYHAGNFADVVKHTVLLQLLKYLQKKVTPYCYIDTHAGEGYYDLSTAFAQKTGEAQAGIERLLQYEGTQPESIQDYLDVVKSSTQYPGSPMIAAKTLRSIDQLILNEKHPETYQLLKQNLKGYKNIAIHQRDAYEFLPAILPPATQRGLVLIDPAFEDDLELEHLKQCLFKCQIRWPQGVYLIWLPIVGRSDYTHHGLEHTGFKNYLTIEFYVEAPSIEAQGLIGCSLVIINPPWQFEAVLKPLLSQLWSLLNKTKVDSLVKWHIRSHIID